MLIKVSDYIIKFLEKKKIKHIFVVTGGAALHLIHSAAKSKKLKFIPTVHEQAAAMAADSYSRVTKKMGVAIATSGPGATNLVTGVSGAFFDSIPVMYITGQVSTTRSNSGTKVRQIGFQETDCVSIFKSITKYVVKIKRADDIGYELQKAYHLSKTGRPGPVLIDIPDNIQRDFINLKKIKKFKLDTKEKSKSYNRMKIQKLIRMIEKSKRPVLIFGWGIYLSSAEKLALRLIRKLNFPVATTWAIAHMIESKEKRNLGTWGTHGTRFSNFAVQNSDLIISIGSRLDTKATGSPINSFARAAKKIVIDIDKFELDKFKKFGLKIDLKIKSDAKKIISQLLKLKINIKKKEIKQWSDKISLWKSKYPIIEKKYFKEKKINPYVFVNELSAQCKKNELLFLDTGCAIAWVMQAFKFKKNQLLFHDFNNTAMGWALPASIAGGIAKNKKRIIAIIGDGSFQLNVQELAVLKKFNLPIKIFIINNSGHAMIRQTQDQWLDSKYFASSFKGGLPEINFQKIANSYGIKNTTCNLNKDLKKIINKVLNSSGPYLCDLIIDSKHRVIPQVKFGRPNEDPEPLLSRKEFLNNMIIDN